MAWTSGASGAVRYVEMNTKFPGFREIAEGQRDAIRPMAEEPVIKGRGSGCWREG